MATLQIRDPYTSDELKRLYPSNLTLQLVQVFHRHGERTPTGPRFENVGLPKIWPYCSIAQQMVSPVLEIRNSEVQWTPLHWQRRIESINENGQALMASGPKGRNDSLCKNGELTDTGRMTTYKLGQRLRHLYVDQLKFLPGTLEDTNIFYLRSSTYPRALESLQQVFRGMYPASTRAKSVGPLTIITRNESEENLYPSFYNCKRFSQLAKAFSQRSAERWNKTTEMEYVNRLLTKWMPEDCKTVAVDSHPRLSGIYDTINATIAHGEETRLPDEFYGAELRKIIDKICIEEWYSGYKESREYRALGIGSLMGDIVDRMTRTVEYNKISESIQLIKDESIIASNDRRNDIKFAINGCHDTTLAAMLTSLDAFGESTWPPFTSHIALELFKKSANIPDKKKNLQSDKTSGISRSTGSPESKFSELMGEARVTRKKFDDYCEEDRSLFDEYFRMSLPSSYRVCCCGRGLGQNPLFTRSRVVERQRRSWHKGNRHQSKKVEDLRPLDKVISLPKKKNLRNDYVPAHGRNYNIDESKIIFDGSLKPDNQPKKFQEDDIGLATLISRETQNNGSSDEANSPIRYIHTKSRGQALQSKIKSELDRLVSLFQNNHSLDSRDSNSGTVLEPVLEHFDHVDTLRNMIDKSKILSEKLNLFRENLDSSTSQASLSRLKIDYATLLQEIIEFKRINPYDSKIPSITEITRIFSQVNALSGSEWADLVMAVLEKILVIQAKGLNYKPLILDVIGAWSAAINNSNFFKTLTPEVTLRHYQKFGLNHLMGEIIPKLKHTDLTGVSAVAFVTFDVLTKKHLKIYDSSDNVRSLIKMLSLIVSIPELDLQSLDIRFQTTSVSSHVIANWDSIRERAHRITSISKEFDENRFKLKPLESDGYKPKLSFVPFPNQARDSSQIYFQLRAAINLKNHIQVDNLWLDVCNQLAYGSKQDIEQALQTWLTPDILNHFITAYMSLQRPEKAINVWVKMVEIGLKPTHKTWNIMISGCKAVGDWRSSEKIWNMMSLSGLYPDLLNWSSRLSVLVESKEVEMGIQALEEMGRKWLEKAQIKHPNLSRDDLLLVEDVQDAVKPDISCINIIISGLLKKNHKYRANAILEWARGFGIQSNTETYNIFLRPLIRRGENREAMELLKRMEEAGVVADVSTYTIILDNVLRFPGKYSLEELKEKIFDVLDEMERNNIKPNLYTYGKIIYQLIRDLNPQNSSLIEAVLRHMMSQSVKPSIHIYTNLVEYYFLQTPPNLNLAQRILDQATQTVGLDRVFWDRVVECYAQIGDTRSALNIIARLSSKKTRVGWSAMRSVLEALLSQKEWHLARSLIHDVKMSASRSDFLSGTKGEALFWQLAARINTNFSS
ncbi:hypothetical protein EPUL_002756 [Erysiphe pulchra]|uniref:Uncharacterized protein n=1 Tax=Erysiphe pulchra TaxID=225359 RepID=A0A2S4PZC3_9PEZI|nr:hypothetical protein EPUL_002756 [Erysiphe pulchra]